jgi:hypothetical protein
MPFETIRQFIALGDLPQAIQVFKNYLQQGAKNPAALRVLQVVESKLNSIKQQERKGLLDLSEAQKAYSHVTDALLGLADDVEAGRTPTMPFSEPPVSNKIYWLIGGGILMLLAIIAVVLIRQGNKPQVIKLDTGETAKQECPEFEPSGFRVLLIPFQKLRGEEAKPELSLQERIRTLTKRNNVNTDVEILRGDRFAGSTPDDKDASRAGTQCQADMVIWGQYESETEGIAIDVRYVFTKSPNIAAGSNLETFKSLTELKSNRMKFNDLEQAVFALCSMMALHEDNAPLVEKWVDKLQNPDPSLEKVKRKLKQQ